MTSARQKGENPFQDAYWVLDPDSNAHRTAEQWRATRPADAAALDKIAGQPAAAWMGNWFPQIELAVKTYVWSRTRAGGLPVMILYNLPFRDCGGYSAGGAGSIAGYHTWIDSVANGIGSRRAVLVLEPDGLPLMSKCLDAKRRRTGGHDSLRGREADGAAGRGGLPRRRPLGLAHGRGDRAAPAGGRDRSGRRLLAQRLELPGHPRFLKYGHQISALLGGKHFIIDTGRNGNGAPQGLGPDDERAWCNPDGRALGIPPTTNTGDPLCDAFYWLKPPGESDGRCNKGPAAGNWWPQKALEMARAATW